MKIHFVCSGNTFRSRLAEAYTKSKNIPGLEVSSSGIYAHENRNGAICSYTADILEEEDLFKYASIHWTQSTKEIIDQQDMVIFMDQEHYDFCRGELKCELDNYEIWNIVDMPEELTLRNHGDREKAKDFAEKTFQKIKTHVNEWLNGNKTL